MNKHSYELSNLRHISLHPRLHGVMSKVLDSVPEISKFELQTRCYDNFQTSTLREGMTPLILPA